MTTPTLELTVGGTAARMPAEQPRTEAVLLSAAELPLSRVEEMLALSGQFLDDFEGIMHHDNLSLAAAMLAMPR